MALYSQEDIFILAIRRSGNHATANWLIPHYNGFVRYFNDFVFSWQDSAPKDYISGNPTYIYYTQHARTCCLLNLGQVWNIQELIARELTKNLKKRTPFWRRRIYSTDKLEQIINELSLEEAASKIPYWIANDSPLEVSANLFGCENHSPHKLAHSFPEWLERIYEPLVRKNKRRITQKRTFILVLRDPFNNLASLMRKPSLWPPNHITIDEFPAIWIAYAQEYLGESSYLKAFGNVVTVNYDAWFLDENYRKSLAQKLGRPFTDGGLQHVSPNGEGSSFEQFDFAGQAQQMNVLERWREFQQDRKYLSLLRNDKLLELYRRIYGEPPFQL